MPLGVSRLPSPLQLPTLSSRLFPETEIENDELNEYELSRNFSGLQVGREWLPAVPWALRDGVSAVAGAASLFPHFSPYAAWRT